MSEPGNTSSESYEPVSDISDSRTHVNLKHEQATLLITLYGRACHASGPRPVLHDPWAQQVVSRIDYDFAGFKVSTGSALMFAARARKFDLWTTQYLASHPTAVVLQLGCGLDARVYRVPAPSGVSWFDVDQPTSSPCASGYCPSLMVPRPSPPTSPSPVGCTSYPRTDLSWWSPRDCSCT